jgi:hypothetical protein
MRSQQRGRRSASLRKMARARGRALGAEQKKEETSGERRGFAWIYIRTPPLDGACLPPTLLPGKKKRRWRWNWGCHPGSAHALGKKPKIFYPHTHTRLGSPRGLTATSMRTTALLSTAWAARPIRAGRAASSGWRRRLCARPCCVKSLLHQKKRHTAAVCSLQLGVGCWAWVACCVLYVILQQITDRLAGHATTG